jgi:molybdopterin/thiamine biosynthesis adenylyltransferase
MGTSHSQGSTMSAEIRIAPQQWVKLETHLLKDRDEHAALLICGHSQGSRGSVLTCREVLTFENDGQSVEISDYLLKISPLVIAKAAKAAAAIGGTLVTCHSHPFPGPVRASAVDLRTEEELCGRVLSSRTGLPAGALIIGPDGYDARVWTPNGATRTDLRVVGQPRAELASPLGDQFDRQILVWGKTGQSALANSRVAVVGLGGTGSQVAAQMAHLGVGQLVLIDPDFISASNLSRVIGSRPSDVGMGKVRIAERYARSVNRQINVVAIEESILDIDISPLLSVDLILCCTDGHGSRALLTEIVQQFLVPMIDLGIEVLPNGRESRSGGGVRIQLPGGPCLQCMGILDPALVREEFLSDSERRDEQRRGYLRGAAEPAPSVVALNGVVASLAVVEALNILVGVFELSPSRLVYRAEERSVRRVQALPVPGCYICSETGVLGLGEARQLPRRRLSS